VSLSFVAFRLTVSRFAPTSPPPRSSIEPTLGELVRRGAEVTLHELDAQERVRVHARETFVDRLRAGRQPDLAGVHRIRHAARRP
jgi:hypothetical protein